MACNKKKNFCLL